MALYELIDSADKNYWGNSLSALSESYSRRIVLTDEELIIVLANKLRHHEYEMNSGGSAIIDAVTNFFRMVLGPLSTYKPIPKKQRDKVFLTGLELEHLHKLCEFETPQEIQTQKDYAMESQILGALLEKAQKSVAAKN